MRKNMKIKHSVSAPPTNYGWTFVIKKVCIAWVGNKRGMFKLGLMIRSCKGGREVLMVKRFQRSSQVSFSLIEPELAYWYIWKVNATNRGLSLKNTVCVLFFLKACLFLKNKKISSDLFFDVFFMGLF